MKGMIKRGSVAGFFFEIVDQTTKHEVHMGILICGLNGSGKSTLGKMLADRIGYDFIDNEDLFFPKTDHAYAFSDLRSKDEVIRLLEEKIENNSRFVYAAVKGDYGKKLIESLECIVLIDVPKEIRRQRVRERSFSKFGERILPGGDLYDRETAWFSLTDSRPEDYTTQWLETVNCPVIHVDGTLPVQQNADYLVQVLGERKMKVIILNGPMGVGKTAVGKAIADQYPGTAFIDGDWCMDIHPFVGNRETKAMAVDNILHLIGNYQKCSVCSMVVLAWLMDDSWVLETIVEGIAALQIEVKSVTLVCSKESLIRRWKNDQHCEWRTDDWLNFSLKSLPEFMAMEHVTDTSDLTVDQVAKLIMR